MTTSGWDEGHPRPRERECGAQGLTAKPLGAGLNLRPPSSDQLLGPTLGTFATSEHNEGEQVSGGKPTVPGLDRQPRLQVSRDGAGKARNPPSLSSTPQHPAFTERSACT